MKIKLQGHLDVVTSKFGHAELARKLGITAQAKSGELIAVKVGKNNGKTHVFGSGTLGALVDLPSQTQTTVIQSVKGLVQ